MRKSADPHRPRVEVLPMILRALLRPALAMLALLSAPLARVDDPAPDPGRYFAIEVVDEQSERGVPLVQLQTTYGTRYYTDSAGLVAFHEPGLMGKRVFF